MGGGVPLPTPCGSLVPRMKQGLGYFSQGGLKHYLLAILVANFSDLPCGVMPKGEIKGILEFQRSNLAQNIMEPTFNILGNFW